jgi:hypothetical protein
MPTMDGLFRIDSLEPIGYSQGCESPVLTGKAVTSPFSEALPSKTFRYAPLDDPSEQTRLCRILSNPDDPGLVVTVDKFDVRHISSRFVALSYACGDESSKVPIQVNGLRFDITQNLHTQLSRLCALGYTGWLWVDALCINQTDDAEKMEQVGVMDRIYSMAEEVVIGFDEDTKDLCQAAADHALVTAAINDMADTMHFDGLSPSPRMQAGQNALDQVLCRFFSSSWWSRSWVIQEVCLAFKPTILLGSGFLPWSTLTQALESWDRHRRADCCSSLIARLPQQSREAYHRV